MSKDLTKLVKKILDDRVQPLFVLVFGSYAKDITRDDSDLDIAYYSLKKLTDYERFLVANELSEECNIEVDLIDIRQVDTVFAAQIFSTGELLYAADKNVFIRDRMKAYSMYATLNEQRAEILRGIKERGSIFGI